MGIHHEGDDTEAAIFIDGNYESFPLPMTPSLAFLICDVMDEFRSAGHLPPRKIKPMKMDTAVRVESYSGAPTARTMQ